MLILSRQSNESIIIDDKITITVVELMDGRVRIGIDAPSDVSIHRKEVYDKIIEETKLAAKAPNKLDEIAKLTKSGIKKKKIK